MTAKKETIMHDGSDSIYRKDQNIEFYFVQPDELPVGFLDEICRMVEAGGSVGTKWLRHNLKRAFLIGYVLAKGIIVGNSCLKRPRPEYIEAVKRQSGLDLSGYLERGLYRCQACISGFGPWYQTSGRFDFTRWRPKDFFHYQ